MALSVLVPRRFSHEEKEELERFLRDAGFERGADGWYREPERRGSLRLRFEEDPVSDPFWISCPLESLYFLPLEEIFLASAEEPSDRERACGLAKGLAKRTRGIIYDHRGSGVYGADGNPFDGWGAEKVLGEGEGDV
jgi:hypothetical protein